MVNRRQKSKKWMQRHLSDPFVQQAQKEGYRSRAVYKLKEIDERYRLFRAGINVVDLGAAPGGWSQYAAKKVGQRGQVIALDILAMEAIDNVTFLQGDFTKQEVLDELISELGGQRVDLVISDMAPNMSGIGVVDQPRTMYLGELAMDFAKNVLKPEGKLLIKTFQGTGFPELRQSIIAGYDKIATSKPSASRNNSREVYLLGLGMKLNAKEGQK